MSKGPPECSFALSSGPGRDVPVGLGPASLLLDKDHNCSRVAWKGGWGRRAEVREPPFPVTSPGFLEAQISGTANSLEQTLTATQHSGMGVLCFLLDPTGSSSRPTQGRAQYVGSWEEGENSAGKELLQGHPGQGRGCISPAALWVQAPTCCLRGTLHLLASR